MEVKPVKLVDEGVANEKQDDSPNKEAENSASADSTGPSNHTEESGLNELKNENTNDLHVTNIESYDTASSSIDANKEEKEPYTENSNSRQVNEDEETGNESDSYDPEKIYSDSLVGHAERELEEHPQEHSLDNEGIPGTSGNFDTAEAGHDSEEKDKNSENSDSSSYEPSDRPNYSIPEGGVEEGTDYNPTLRLADQASAETVTSSKQGSESPSVSKPQVSVPRKPPAGLPPKPPVSANGRPFVNIPSNHSVDKLKNSYEAILQSDIMKDPNFLSLSQTDQMKRIVEELAKRNMSPVLSNSNSVSESKQINYDQVFSYNKPFKNLRNPIPLIPVNEYCRRPNITAPMTPEEEKDYSDFIKKESEYMALESWDEFPDNLRLFIGNLPANTISKQDLFRIFSQYGEVIQIAIKAGYGFAQFRTAEACFDCIKGESNVPLHNKIMRLDASRPQKSRKQGKHEINSSSRGRERTAGEPVQKHGRGDVDYPNDTKRPRSSPDCAMYITGKSSVFFTRKVKKIFSSSQIAILVEDVTHKDLSEAISEAAYSGIAGACIVKESKVDLHIFENTSDGGIRFDEYTDIEPEVAADILSKAKTSKYGALSSPPPYPMQGPLQAMRSDLYNTNYNDNANNAGRNIRNAKFDRGNRARGSRLTNTASLGTKWSNMYNESPRNAPPVPYGQSHPPNYGPAQLPIYGQLQPLTYGAPSNPVSVSPPAPAPQSAQQNLIGMIQSMDPDSMQNLITLLQQQKNQQQFQPQNIQMQQTNQPPFGFPQQLNYDQAPIPPHGSSTAPSAQVNDLLSQLQSSQPIQSNITDFHQSNHQTETSTQDLMETLARLSRK